jgi:hypothetical protein
LLKCTTYIIKDDFDKVDWLKTKVIRAIDICTSLADFSLDMTDAEIKESFSVSSFFKESLKIAESNFIKLIQLSDKDWQKKFQEYLELEDKRLQEDSKKYDIERNRFIKLRTDLQTMREEAEKQDDKEAKELFINIIDFTIREINYALEHEYKEEKYDIYGFFYSDWQDYRVRIFGSVLHDIEDYSKKIREERKRSRRKLELYNKWCNFVDNYNNQEKK